MTYAPDRIYEEVAYIAFHFHWPLDDLLDLEHAERQRFADEIGRINNAIDTREVTGGPVVEARPRHGSGLHTASSSARPPPVQRAAWRDLPPLRPTVTATPPVAPLDSFTASLATARNPSFLGRWATSSIRTARVEWSGGWRPCCAATGVNGARIGICFAWRTVRRNRAASDQSLACAPRPRCRA